LSSSLGGCSCSTCSCLGLFFTCGDQVLSWLVPKHSADSDGLTFVTESEATELWHLVVLLQRDRDACLNATDDLSIVSCVLRLLLLDGLASLVFLIGDKNFLDSCLIRNCMNVDDALITLGEDGLVSK